MTSKEEDAKWPKLFSVVYMQELLLKQTMGTVQAFKGYPSYSILLQIV